MSPEIPHSENQSSTQLPNQPSNQPDRLSPNQPETDPETDRPADVTDLTDLYVSWDDYHRLIERLALQLYQSDWAFNQIVCLAKGGLRVGDTLARMFDCP